MGDSTPPSWLGDLIKAMNRQTQQIKKSTDRQIAEMRKERRLYMEKLDRNISTNSLGVQPSTPTQKASLRPEEVGIFSPGVDEVQDAPVTTEGKLTIYKDVFAFESRIKDVALIYGAHQAKEVLPKCLRGHSSMWYSTILDHSTKYRLNSGELSDWLLQLTDRFMKNSAQAFDVILKE